MVVVVVMPFARLPAAFVFSVVAVPQVSFLYRVSIYEYLLTRNHLAPSRGLQKPPSGLQVARWLSVEILADQTPPFPFWKALTSAQQELQLLADSWRRAE